MHEGAGKNLKEGSYYDVQHARTFTRQGSQAGGPNTSTGVQICSNARLAVLSKLRHITRVTHQYMTE